MKTRKTANLQQREKYTKRFAQKRGEEKRKNSSARGYDRRWEALRIAVIRERIHEGCTFCGQALDQIDLSFAHVDHIERIADRPDLQYERSNLRVMHAKCHRRMTITEDHDTRRGYTTEAGADGFPTDARHPWNANTT